MTTDQPAIEPLEFTVAGGTLAAIRIGPADAPPVLAVHGITGNNRAWVPAARALAGRASLIAVDLRGRGGSRALPPPYGPAAYVADLAAVIEQASLAPALVAGHSLGAYIVSRLAVEHPDLARAVLLVDGGLAIPGTENVDPQVFATAFLGPALARLSMQFPDRDAYLEWWHAHPAFQGGEIAAGDLERYADADLVGTPPALHSAVVADAVRTDAGELTTLGAAAHRIEQPAILLAAPRGLQDEPNPMQPMGSVDAWATERAQRTGRLVEDVNHYTITLGARGGAAIAGAITELLA